VNEKCSFTSESNISLLFTLLRAAQAVETRVEIALGEVGLSLAKLGVLNHLVQADEPLPLGQIAGRIACVKSNVTQLVDRLEIDGLVSRVSDPYDRRSIRAAITEEGRRKYQNGAEVLRRQEAALVEEIAPVDRAEAVKLLEKLGQEVVAR
jgi:DNA-binding MarR family transcriptional regulator